MFQNTHLEDGVHDAGERPVVGVPGHVEDVEAPLVEVFQFLLGEHKEPEWFEWFPKVPKYANLMIIVIM